MTRLSRLLPAEENGQEGGRFDFFEAGVFWSIPIFGEEFFGIYMMDILGYEGYYSFPFLGILRGWFL